MNCDVSEATEGLKNELWCRWSDENGWRMSSAVYLYIYELCSFSNLSHHFTYVTAHSPTLLSLYLRHSSFSNPSFTSPMSLALHLRHLASHPWILGLFQEISHGISFFKPTVEDASQTGEEEFISEYPINIMSMGTFNQVPFMSGTVSQEGMIRLGGNKQFIIPHNKHNVNGYVQPSTIHVRNCESGRTDQIGR